MYLLNFVNSLNRPRGKTARYTDGRVQNFKDFTGMAPEIGDVIKLIADNSYLLDIC